LELVDREIEFRRGTGLVVWGKKYFEVSLDHLFEAFNEVNFSLLQQKVKVSKLNQSITICFDLAAWLGGIASASETEDLWFESRQSLRFLGHYKSLLVCLFSRNTKAD
jgi:hypothetical protein